MTMRLEPVLAWGEGDTEKILINQGLKCIPIQFDVGLVNHHPRGAIDLFILIKRHRQSTRPHQRPAAGGFPN